MVNIKDVAAVAGVSDKTVSRVVNGEPNVRPATKKRVEAAIREMGYVPNQAARLVRTNRSRIIGVITDEISTTPNSVEIVHGVQDRIAQSNHSLLIANTGKDPAIEARAWQTFREHRIDGVILATMYHREVSVPEAAQAMPIVLANCYTTQEISVSSVIPDDYQGGYAAARHAIGLGHRKIAYITLNPLIRAAELRGAAFRDALKEAKLEVREDWIVPGFIGPARREALCAADAVRQIMHGGADDRPTAILCGNDEVALQVLCALQRDGIRVPGEVGVIGFDDFQMISTRTEPALTTVSLPYYQIGARAADRLLATLSGAEDKGGVEKIACPIVPRQSA